MARLTVPLLAALLLPAGVLAKENKPACVDGACLGMNLEQVRSKSTLAFGPTAAEKRGGSSVGERWVGQFKPIFLGGLQASQLAYIEGADDPGSGLVFQLSQLGAKELGRAFKPQMCSFAQFEVEARDDSGRLVKVTFEPRVKGSDTQYVLTSITKYLGELLPSDLSAMKAKFQEAYGTGIGRTFMAFPNNPFYTLSTTTLGSEQNAISAGLKKLNDCASPASTKL